MMGIFIKAIAEFMKKLIIYFSTISSIVIGFIVCRYY